MMRFALIGCGNIGGFIANAVDRGIIHCELVAAFDKDKEKAVGFNKYMSNKIPIVDSLEELIKDADLVVEAASQEAVREYGLRVLDSGRDLMILSVGALSDAALWREMKKAAKKNEARIFIPSGGIVGLDGLNAAKLATIDSVEITTRKNPASLGVNVSDETVLYEGPALEGVKRYPRNVNVAATLGVAGVGIERTWLKLIADPAVTENIHEVRVKGDFGEFTTIAKNHPSRENPKTSWIAALSAIAMLKKMGEVVHVGT